MVCGFVTALFGGVKPVFGLFDPYVVQHLSFNIFVRARNVAVLDEVSED